MGSGLPFTPSIFIFFFGPGFPLGFGTASAAICEALRFKPGLGPGRLLRFVGGTLDASPFGVSTPLSPGFGVDSIAELEGDDTTSSTFSGKNFFKAGEENLRVMIRLFALFEPLVLVLVDEPFVGVDGMISLMNPKRR